MGRGRAEGAGEGLCSVVGPAPSPNLLWKSTSPRWGEVNRVRGRGSRHLRDPLRNLRIELALGVALRHLGWRQHLLDLACLACGIEFFQPLPAELGHRL